MAKVELVIWDVQHGNALYIKTPNGRHIVIDLGVGSYKRHGEGFSPLMHLRVKYKIERIDYLLVTHPHKDHIDDMLNFKNLKPKVFKRPYHITRADIMEGVLEKDMPIFTEYFDQCDTYNNPLAQDHECYPNNPNNWGGLKIDFFDTPNFPKSNLNNHSVVTVLSYLGMKIVLPGDNEFASLQELMKNEEFKKCVKDADVLLAPHHGRESAFSPDFVKHVNPRLVVVSDGSYCDTSAIDRYRPYCRGWKVHKSGEGTERKTLSTYNDGVVVVHFGNENQKNYLYVKTITMEVK